MGQIKEQVMDIIEALEATDMDFEVVANRFGLSLVEVYEIGKEHGDFFEDPGYDDSMDGDFDSAMASAGFGTDEDYGYYGDE
jgi:hypothetical protein